MTEHSKISINSETISLPDIESLKSLVGFRAEVKKITPGFELSNPIVYKSGMMLYPAGKELDYDTVARLIEMNKKDAFQEGFVIRKSSKLYDSLRGKITSDFKRLMETKKNRREYGTFIKNIEKTFEYYIDEILDENSVYTLNKMRILDEKITDNIYNHSVYTALYSLGIAKLSFKYIKPVLKKEDYIKLSKAALFHNIGALENIDEFIHISLPESRKVKYLDLNQQSAGILRNMGINNGIGDAVKKCANYFLNEFDTTQSDIGSTYANIIIVADIYDKGTSGLFQDRKSPKEIIDQALYVEATNGKLKKMFIDSLANGLRLKYLFDFYWELDKLKKACLTHPKDDYPTPYPMKKLGSPTVILCKGKDTACQYYAKTERAVTLIRESSGLKPGSYGRCKLLSDQLNQFYKKFYKEIKDITSSSESQDS